MKVLFLNTSFPPMARSAAQLFFDLGRYLVERGHDVDVVTEMPWRRMGSTGEVPAVGLPRLETIAGMNVARVGRVRFSERNLFARGINALFLPLLFYRGLRSKDYDVVLVYSPPLTLGITAWYLRRRRGIPFVFNVQDIYPQTLIELKLIKNRFLIACFEWLERALYKRAARIVVHSEGNQSYLLENRSNTDGKTVVIPNWIDLQQFRPADRMNPFRTEHDLGDAFVVCYAGTMGYAQDLTSLIEAAGELRHIDDLVFLLIGEGVREAEWRSMAAAGGLTNVRFLPLVPPDVYRSAIAAADIGIVPLSDEIRTPVVPGKLLDFMAAARPVISISNKESDLYRIVTGADCGYAMLPGERSSLVKAIEDLHDDPARGRDMGTSGRDYAQANFSLEACAGRYEQIFGELFARVS